ncbi:MAG: hypothetical protein JW891_01470 [Candidatus Lokiarchaeota archaeon]|nr:hypothetical protein [Candidatus Lokiarchaeota archaeon]
MRLIVIGGGKFGKKALEFGRKKNAQSILIDIDPSCIASKMINRQFISQEELLSSLNEINPGEIYFLIHEKPNLEKLLYAFHPEYIIPVIPIHLIASMIVRKLDLYGINLFFDDKSSQRFVSKANQNLILNSDFKNGVVLLSYAKNGEICPDDCAGPLHYCPNFKREKPITITQHIKEIILDFKDNERENKNSYFFPFIVESQQLRSGLGGIKGTDLKCLFDEIDMNLEKIKYNKCEIIVATTCNCHGIINFFYKKN